MFFFGFQFFEEQREQQCEQFKELLKDKEEEIQILIHEREKQTQQLDEDEISLLNNQVRLFEIMIEVKTLLPCGMILGPIWQIFGNCQAASINSANFKCDSEMIISLLLPKFSLNP